MLSSTTSSTTIAKLRINEKNKVYTEIKSVEKSIDRISTTISRLQESDEYNTIFNMKQIENLVIKKNDFETQIIELNEKIVNITLGKFDLSFNEKNDENNTKMHKKQLETEKKNKEKEEKKVKDKVQIKKSYDLFKDKNMEYAVAREEQKYYKNLKTVPDFMREKLKNMPSNKGYIWRDIWCMGAQKSQSNVITMFEKQKQGKLRIIEIDDKYRSVYEKIGNNSPKVLIERLPRNRF